jgi:hypothetical protein
MALTFPISRPGLVVDVLVNHAASVVLAGRTAGHSLAPRQTTALIDTANDMTGVSVRLLQQLQVPSVGDTNTSGIGGSVPVTLHEISLYVFDARNPGLPWIPFAALTVFSLPPDIPFDVLIGMDVLRTCRLVVDGPAGSFALDP